MTNTPYEGLVASYWTLAGVSPPAPARNGFAERAVAAAKAGFGGIGLRFDDYERCIESGLSPREMRSILEDSGLRAVELEMVYGWASDDPDERAYARKLEDTLYAAADALQGRQVHAGQEPPGLPDIDRVIERFAALADRAASHGLLVALAFTPWSGIPDATTANAIICGANRPNAGVLVDVWHYFRGTPDPAAIRAIGLDRIIGIQLNDADAEVRGTLREDARHHRRLPGHGSFDLVSFIQLLDEMGVRAPMAVEVVSDELAALPVDEAARLAYDAAAQVLEKARAQGQ